MENSIIQFAMPLALGLMMVGVGLNLETKNFSTLLKKPKPIIIGVLLQMLGVPFLGFLVSCFFSVTSEEALGIMILTSCAGGVISSLLTQLAKGDVALSIIVTCICMLFGFITIPIFINLSIEYFASNLEMVKLNLLPTSLRLLSITIIPISIGLFIRKKYFKFALKVQPTVAKLSNFLLLGIIISFIVKDLDLLVNGLQELFPVLITLNLIAMSLGIILAKLFKLKRNQGIALSIEAGIQNSATGMFIATTLLANQDLALPSIIYTAISYMTVGLLIFGRRYFNEENSILEAQYE